MFYRDTDPGCNLCSFKCSHESYLIDTINEKENEFKKKLSEKDAIIKNLNNKINNKLNKEKYIWSFKPRLSAGVSDFLFSFSLFAFISLSISFLSGHVILTHFLCFSAIFVFFCMIGFYPYKKYIVTNKDV